MGSHNEAGKDAGKSKRSMGLEGIRVIEIGGGLAGTNVSVMLADLGADVIKVEPIKGEIARGLIAHTGILQREAIEDSYWLSFNRNKRDIAVDWTTPEGAEIVRKLAKTADVVISNVRPFALDRQGLGYDDLSKTNPRLIYAEQSGWGIKGPKADWIAIDFTAQAASGFMAANGLEGGWPLPSPTVQGDQAGAWTLAYGIMTALYVRERTGEGQKVEASLVRAQIALQTFEFNYHLLGGPPIPRPLRNHMLIQAPLFGTFQAKDGWIIMGGVNPDRWPVFCKALDAEHIQNDPRFADPNNRNRNGAELVLLLDEIFKKKTRAEWMTILQAADQVCAPVYNRLEAINEPQMWANDYFIEVENEKRGRKGKLVNYLVGFSKTPIKIKANYPAIGEHNSQILKELGYGEDDISELTAKGVLGFE